MFLPDTAALTDGLQDQDGYYDTQYSNYNQDCRGRLYTDEEGRYAFRAVLPVAYPIPNDVSSSLEMDHG